MGCTRWRTCRSERYQGIIVHGPDAPPEGLYEMNVYLSGFPCYALSAGTIEVRDALDSLVVPEREYWGVRLRPMSDPSLGLLPLHPLWPGFALNTIFYSGLAWGLWQVPLAIRRRRRRRLNRCVKCGYDRAGLAADAHCPECGTIRATTSARRTQ
jgi:hypothetical protein